ncbi:MAG: hypothetical protein KGQ93_07075 [Cyanobacteria bacterium REEB459]|nr:hypothetical protein [Cyanobacteria bacterium REEB459]
MVDNLWSSPVTLERYAPLRRSQVRVESPRYRCPVANCHQSWYRHSLTEPIPTCPIHALALVRTSKA